MGDVGVEIPPLGVLENHGGECGAVGRSLGTSVEGSVASLAGAVVPSPVPVAAQAANEELKSRAAKSSAVIFRQLLFIFVYLLLHFIFYASRCGSCGFLSPPSVFSMSPFASARESSVTASA